MNPRLWQAVFHPRLGPTFPNSAVFKTKSYGRFKIWGKKISSVAEKIATEGQIGCFLGCQLLTMCLESLDIDTQGNIGPSDDN